ncbi:hypothetical protein AA103581_1688 [Gluconobacter wancherniae NBRC 103581]|nr:hypothetical protein AA103581_1688 [Gluconobacter wancherniae NBRC 103581]
MMAETLGRKLPCQARSRAIYAPPTISIVITSTAFSTALVARTDARRPMIAIIANSEAASPEIEKVCSTKNAQTIPRAAFNNSTARHKGR